MILDDIVAKKKIYLDAKKQVVSEIDMRQRAAEFERTPLSLSKALKRADKISIIAEVKKASPSRGLIRADFSHTDIARQYVNSDVQAMSVLTEEDFFLGSPSYLSDIRRIADIPLLRKDFIIDEYQIFEAYLLGADAILLIAAILDDAQLEKFAKTAHKLGMECLFETHDQAEIERVTRLGARIVGINNRNLHDFSEDINTTARLAKYLPDNAVIVSESSIKTAEDLVFLRNAGADAVLIGEQFMRSEDIFAAVERIRGR